MNEVWNLDPIYHNFEDPAFHSDLQKLREEVEAFGALVRDLTKFDETDALRRGIACQES